MAVSTRTAGNATPATAITAPIPVVPSLNAAIAGASTHVITQDMTDLRNTYAQMVASAGDEGARDNFVRQGNTQILHIHAVAQTMMDFMTAAEKKSMQDSLLQLNRDYTDALTQAGVSIQHVSIDQAKPELSGPIKDAFNSSFSIHHSTLDEFTQHMHDSLSADMERIRENLSNSGIDMMILTQKLGDIKAIVSQGMVPLGTLPSADEATTITMPIPIPTGVVEAESNADLMTLRRPVQE